MPVRDEQQSPLYTDETKSLDEYEIDPGVCVLPVAGPEPEDPVERADWSPVVFLRLHAPYRVRKSVARAVKTSNPPVVPAPADAGAFVFVGGHVQIANAMNTSLAAFDWTVTTEFVFVEDCPHALSDGFVLTAAPFTYQTQAENALGGSRTVTSLGAVSLAGADARVGYYQGAVIPRDPFGAWRYNTPTYYPGHLFNEDLVNGGPNPLRVTPPLPTS
jgi:hypothetical protein